MSPPLPSAGGSPTSSPQAGKDDKSRSVAGALATPEKSILGLSTPEKGLAGVGLAGAGMAASPVPAQVPQRDKSAGSGEKKANQSAEEEIEEEDGLDDGSISPSGSASQSGARSQSGSRGKGLPRPGEKGPIAALDPTRLEHSGPMAMSGSGGKGCSSASELSDDFVSEHGSGLFRGRANSIGGDTLELSASAFADGEDLLSGPMAAAAAAASRVAGPAKATPQQLDSQISSLAKSLTMLKDIRERQQQYLEMLMHGTVSSAAS